VLCCGISSYSCEPVAARSGPAHRNPVQHSSRQADSSMLVLTEATKPRLSGAVVSERADDGTRTHDLLHGKRVVGDAMRTTETRWSSGIRRSSHSGRPPPFPAFSRRFTGIWAYDTIVVPSTRLPRLVQHVPAVGTDLRARRRVRGGVLAQGEEATRRSRGVPRRSPHRVTECARPAPDSSPPGTHTRSTRLPPPRSATLGPRRVRAQSSSSGRVNV
jgi:hypothetical protein